MSEIDFSVRLAEALLFASPTPLTEAQLAERLPAETEIAAVLARLAEDYASRGVQLTAVGGGWAFRTAPDLAAALRSSVEVPRKLSRAAIEALAIIAYHQPVTRGEIEEIRGVALSKGTLDVLLEASWIKPRGRKQTPGRPVMWATTDEFLNHFGLASVDDLPGVEELKAAGLLDRRPTLTTLAMREAERGDPGDESEDEDAEAAATDAQAIAALEAEAEADERVGAEPASEGADDDGDGETVAGFDVEAAAEAAEQETDGEPEADLEAIVETETASRETETDAQGEGEGEGHANGVDEHDPGRGTKAEGGDFAKVALGEPV